MIRDYRQEDLDSCLGLIHSVCDELGRSFDRHSTALSLCRTRDQGHSMRVVEEDGNIVGMAVVMFFSRFTNDEEKLGYEAMWHSLPSLPPRHRARIMLNLLEDMERICDEAGADLHVSPSEQGASRKLGIWLRKHGWCKVETIHHKE